MVIKTIFNLGAQFIWMARSVGDEFLTRKNWTLFTEALNFENWHKSNRQFRWLWVDSNCKIILPDCDWDVKPFVSLHLLRVSAATHQNITILQLFPCRFRQPWTTTSVNNYIFVSYVLFWFTLSYNQVHGYYLSLNTFLNFLFCVIYSY